MTYNASHFLIPFIVVSATVGVFTFVGVLIYLAIEAVDGWGERYPNRRRPRR
jgi:hypothetical protein